MYLGQVRGPALASAFWGIAAGYRESPDTTASWCRSAGGGYAAGRSAAGPGTGIATGGYEDGSEGRRRYVWPGEHRAARQVRGGQQPDHPVLRGTWHPARAAPVTRSEERRVGKECRSRWSPY